MSFLSYSLRLRTFLILPFISDEEAYIHFHTHFHSCAAPDDFTMIDETELGDENPFFGPLEQLMWEELAEEYHGRSPLAGKTKEETLENLKKQFLCIFFRFSRTSSSTCLILKLINK